jgi:tryptophan synthase beta chain
MLFPKGFVEHETSMAGKVPVPADVLDVLSSFRPTPLFRARSFERSLGTPARIFCKFEGVSPTGSHKSNTALVQASLARAEGVERLVTETGAGQWGCALAHACSLFGLSLRVFMVRASFRQKPGRKSMMDMLGAEVFESPSMETESGRSLLSGDGEHPGSLGIAISEAVEEVAGSGGRARYSLGSVLDAVLLHQSIIGQEALMQMEGAGEFPDVVIGCVGGGSNFGGVAFPFLARRLSGGDACRLVAVEPSACASMTRGQLRYDNGDTAGLTPLLFMHTLGRDFIPPAIHAGGLRYHGMAPLVSHCAALGYVEPVAVDSGEALRAAGEFFRTEGILPAPESSHALAQAAREALRAGEEGRRSTILVNISGHGLLDLAAFAS